MNETEKDGDQKATADALAALIVSARLTPEMRKRMLDLARPTRTTMERKITRLPATIGDRVTIIYTDGSKDQLLVSKVGQRSIRLTTGTISGLTHVMQVSRERLLRRPIYQFSPQVQPGHGVK